jgi:phenylacetate-CoA ligase
MIAKYAANNSLDLSGLGVKVAFVTSERLYDHQREAIEKGFGCPVANGYGGRDAGFIAHQCPKGAMHITSEDIVVEIVDNKGKVLPAGDKGEIVVTHMATSEFPFVRYRTGDVGTLSKEACSCGRGLPVLAEIEGRTTDFVVAADGTVLHGLAFIYVLRDLPEVAAFKIIQESVTNMTVQLVTESSERKKLEAIIVNQFRQRLGETLAVNFEYVTEIQREASGKFRYVVSKVGH